MIKLYHKLPHLSPMIIYIQEIIPE